jgi:hypothetical protein
VTVSDRLSHRHFIVNVAVADVQISVRPYYDEDTNPSWRGEFAGVRIACGMTEHGNHGLKRSRGSHDEIQEYRPRGTIEPKNLTSRKTARSKVEFSVRR